MSSHVLVVEDSALVTGAMRVLFEATGHRFSEAATVAAALRVCEEECPDIMFLDLTLPDGEGFEVLERLRASGGTIPITVVLTGRDDPNLTSRCLALGCREVLLKPVAPRILLRKLEELRERA